MKIFKVIIINFLIFFFILIILEAIFGYWFKGKNFSTTIKVF